MLHFLCRFAFFNQLFVFQTGDHKITQILKNTHHTACQHGPFSKDDKILIKSLYECKGYNTRQFITEFPDKGWTKNSVNRLLVKLRKFGTV